MFFFIVLAPLLFDTNSTSLQSPHGGYPPPSVATYSFIQLCELRRCGENENAAKVI